MSAFDEKKIYEFGLTNVNGTNTAILGSGSYSTRSLRFFPTNRSRGYQQWTVTYVASTPDYPYRLRVRQSGYYLNTHCDYQQGKDCSKGTVNRVTLISVNQLNEIPETGWWNAVPSDSKDGTYQWFSKGNGTMPWLEGDNIAIFLTSNSSTGHGGKWKLTSVSEIDTSQSSPLPSPSPRTVSSPGYLSNGAIAGVVVGVVFGIGLLLGALFFWCRGRPRKQQDPTHQSDKFASEIDGHVTTELDGHITAELDGHASSELDGRISPYSPFPFKSPCQSFAIGDHSIMNTPHTFYDKKFPPQAPVELPA